METAPLEGGWIIAPLEDEVEPAPLEGASQEGEQCCLVTLLVWLQRGLEAWLFEPRHC
jgi:hypothetical protein